MFAAPILVVMAIFFVGCDTGPGESVYDPNRESLPDPTIGNFKIIDSKAFARG